MGVRHEGVVLREVAQGLLRTLEALRGAKPLELVEAEVEIPFAGTRVGDIASAGLGDFRDVSLLAEDIGPSGDFNTWRLRISIAKGQAVVLRVERYDTPSIS
jgi:hypothetical protein